LLTFSATIQTQEKEDQGGNAPHFNITIQNNYYYI